MSQSPSPSDQVTEAWRRHRPYLVNLAYQMLGDVGDAEDVAQEAFLRLSRVDLNSIDDVRGWLTVVASRLCLDQVRSARARYERPGEVDERPAPRRLDPADRVTLDDEVRTALMEVLRRLSPGERVAFVLHDVFGVPFDTIAETVGRPVGTCRQLARRARAKFGAAQPKLAAGAPWMSRVSRSNAAPIRCANPAQVTAPVLARCRRPVSPSISKSSTASARSGVCVGEMTRSSAAGSTSPADRVRKTWAAKLWGSKAEKKAAVRTIRARPPSARRRPCATWQV